MELYVRSLHRLSGKRTHSNPTITIEAERKYYGVGAAMVAPGIKYSIDHYLTDHAEARASSIAEYIGLKPSCTRDYLNELIAEGIVVAGGGNRNRIYKLKA